MNLDAKFELRIDGDPLLQIQVSPHTHPDEIADMLEGFSYTFREGVTNMMDKAETSGLSSPSEPPPWQCLYYNYDPAEFEGVREAAPDYELLTADDVAEFEHIDTSADDQETTTPRTDFYGEHPLIGETTYTINGVPAVKLNYHPSLGIDEIAVILEDAARDLRQELAGRQPVQYDDRTVSLTVPATRVGQHILNQLNCYNKKFEMAVLAESDEAAEKFFVISEKLYGWICRNYTPEAIKNSPELQQTRRLETFRGIKLAPLHEEEPTNDGTD